MVVGWRSVPCDDDHELPSLCKVLHGLSFSFLFCFAFLCCCFGTSQICNKSLRTAGLHHRWELLVGNYPGKSGNYHYPFFWVIFMVILHDFICKNYHENQSDRYPFFSHNGNYPSFLIIPARLRRQRALMRAT